MQRQILCERSLVGGAKFLSILNMILLVCICCKNGDQREFISRKVSTETRQREYNSSGNHFLFSQEELNFFFFFSTASVFLHLAIVHIMRLNLRPIRTQQWLLMTRRTRQNHLVSVFQRGRAVWLLSASRPLNGRVPTVNWCTVGVRVVVILISGFSG